jgi:hypothetical protein
MNQVGKAGPSFPSLAQVLRMKTLFDDYCRDDAAGDVAPKSKGSIHDSE